MKHFLLAFSSIILFSGLYAQNVGIGTSSPASLLHVKSPSGNTFIRIDNTSGTAQSGVDFYVNGSGKTNLYFDPSTTYGPNGGLIMNNYAVAPNLILNRQGGNVGIGVDNPNYQLEMSGSIKFKGMTATSGATAGYVMVCADGTGTGVWTNPATIAAAFGSGTQNYIPKFNAGGTSVGNSQIVDNGTNVGIGIGTGATTLLHIKSAASSNAFLTIDVTTATQQSGIQLAGTGTTKSNIYFDPNTTTYGTNGALLINNVGVASPNTLLNPSGNGAVAIGLNGVPTNTFDVTGSIRFRNLSAAGIVTNTSTGVLGTLAGTTTTVLHGNAAGLPTYSAVALGSDVSGTLPIANGGTGSATQNWVDLTTTQTAAGAKTWSGIASFTSGTASTNTTTGSVVVTGGAGISGNVNVGGTETVTGLVTQSGGLTETGTANINTTGSAVTTIGVGGTGAVNLGNTTGGVNVKTLTTAGVVTNTVAGLLGTLAGTTSTVLHGNAAGTPTFGAVALGSEVSGTLPVGNGGTGTSTTFTTGSVVFAGASGVFSQNNANFFWDNTNNRLGLGTTSPGQTLDVNGNICLPSGNGSGNKQIYTWLATDANWRIGMSSTPGFTRALATSHVEYLTFANGAGQGFAVGDNLSGLSSFEVTSSGSGYASFFRGAVGIGTTAPKGSIGFAKLAIDGTVSNAAGPHVQYTTSADNYPVAQQLNWSHDNISLAFDGYYDGAWRSATTSGGTFQIYKIGGQLNFNYSNTNTQGTAITYTNGMAMDLNGNIGINTTPSSIYRLYSYNMQLTANGDGQASLYGYRTRDSQNDGTGYGVSTTNSGVQGYTFWGDLYSFGTTGYSYGDYTRTGGVEGAVSTTSAWGILGYKNSGSSFFGVYGSGGYSSGTGYAADNNKVGIGGGFFGDVVGSVSKADLIGSMNQGEMMAQYNLGNVYTSGYHADVVDNGSERMAAYSVTSTGLKLYSDGTAKLINGTVFVPFTEDFKKMTATTPTVTISPIGMSQGVYIERVTKEGFYVKEMNNGTSSVDINWIAIGNRIDAAKATLPAEVAQKDFDKNINDFMFNDANTEQSAKPMWWDGTKLRYDAIPQQDHTAEKQKEQARIEAQRTKSTPNMNNK